MRQPALSIRLVRFDKRLRADVLLVPVPIRRGKPVVGRLAGLPAIVSGRLDELARHYHGLKQAGSVDAVTLPPGSPFRRIALVSLGGEKQVKAADVRDAAGLAIGWCARHRVPRVAVAVETLRLAGSDELIGYWVEGTILGGYRFVRHRSRWSDNGAARVASVCLASSGPATAKLRAVTRRAGIVAESANLARTLGHEPPNIINPVTLTRRIRAIARKFGLRCRVLEERQLRVRKMGAILAVGGGSVSKARVIVLEHPGHRASTQPVVLVGKAVTLDTGGYSIKPAASMANMKYDKCGGMAVVGVLVAAARLGLRRRIVGVIGAVENMISGEAYRPGDIVTASNGTTIEITNTDAEGRLVLADCLHYAEKTYHPSALIDVATLTGACEVALGDACAGLFASDDELADALVDAGERTGERLWRLPLWPAYREQISGTDADIKNTGGRLGGSITAAMFLKEFVSDKTPWAHLDIAGVSDTTKPLPTCPVGATGFGVRLLVDYIQHRNGR